jgi:hypothetical protein
MERILYLIILILFQEDAYCGIRKRVILPIENADWSGDCLQIVVGGCLLVVLSHVQLAVVVLQKLAWSCKVTHNGRIMICMRGNFLFGRPVT